MFGRAKNKVKALKDEVIVERKDRDFRIVLSMGLSGKSACRSGFPFVDSVLASQGLCVNVLSARALGS